MWMLSHCYCVYRDCKLMEVCTYTWLWYATAGEFDHGMMSMIPNHPVTMNLYKLEIRQYWMGTVNEIRSNNPMFTRSNGGDPEIVVTITLTRRPHVREFDLIMKEKLLRTWNWVRRRSLRREYAAPRRAASTLYIVYTFNALTSVDSQTCYQCESHR